MSAEVKTPEICSKCKNPLELVDYHEYSQWKFNPETGSYDNTTIYGGTAEVKCAQHHSNGLYCGNDVIEHFPEGPANK